MTYDFVSGDTGSKLKVTVKDAASGAAVNLTGMTVRLKWYDPDGALVTKTMTNDPNPALGVSEYQFDAGELYAGTMKFEVEVTDAGGKIVSGLDLIQVSVRPQFE
jgi:hypothetical protein